MRTRNLRVDGLKFFLVCMVVLGHCIQPFRYDSMVLGGMYGIIYSFHMPLFVILSGYFFRVDDLAKEAWRCLRLFETFVVVTLVFWLLSGMSYTWPLVRIGSCPSWYLFSLVCWRAIGNLALKKMPFKCLFALSALASVMLYIVLNVGEGMFGIMRTVQFFPYFLFGYALSLRIINLETPKSSFLYVIATMSIFVFMLYPTYAIHTQEFQNVGILHWSKMFGVNILGAAEVFLFVKIASIAMSYAVWRIVKLPDCVTYYGKYTLLVFIVHTMFLPLMYRFCESLWQTTIMGVFTIVGALLVTKTKLHVFVINPISTVFLIARKGQSK